MPNILIRLVVAALCIDIVSIKFNLEVIMGISVSRQQEAKTEKACACCDIHLNV
tara:strand:- start:1 stop:162 length:162 start_codon:yes stop_codon:yes gene_type:complete